MPDDLESQKKEINDQLHSLANQQPSTETEIINLISNYNSLKQNAIDYTTEANNRGIKKNNDAALADIDQRLNYLYAAQLDFEKEAINQELQNLQEPTEDNISVQEPTEGNISELNNYLEKLKEIRANVQNLQEEANQRGITYRGTESTLASLDLKIAGISMQVDALKQIKTNNENSH